MIPKLYVPSHSMMITFGILCLLLSFSIVTMRNAHVWMKTSVFSCLEIEGGDISSAIRLFQRCHLLTFHSVLNMTHLISERSHFWKSQ